MHEDNALISFFVVESPDMLVAFILALFSGVFERIGVRVKGSAIVACNSVLRHPIVVYYPLVHSLLLFAQVVNEEILAYQVYQFLFGIE